MATNGKVLRADAPRNISCSLSERVNGGLVLGVEIGVLRIGE